MAFLLAYGHNAQAGLFSDIFKLFVGGSQETVNSSAAAISMPLLGSQLAQSMETGTGGLDIDEEIPQPLPAVQDSALIGSRNPAGTLPLASSEQIVVYKVREGDSPSKIAESFGISLNTLLWANNLRDANKIKIGDELIILPVSGVKYQVKSGDTIDSIAKKLKGDADEIMSFNGLAIGEKLKVGMTLIIPDGEFTPAAPAPTGKPSSRFANLPSAGDGYYIRPILGGRKTQGIHGFNGVDLANSCGLPVMASAKGNVIIARGSGWNGGYGKYVVISHSNGTQTLYSHLSSVFVNPGDDVGQGFVIGAIGSSGNSTGCHVHFEVRGAKNPF